MAYRLTHFVRTVISLFLAVNDAEALKIFDCSSINTLAPDGHGLFHCFDKKTCVDSMGGHFEFLCVKNRTAFCPDSSDQSNQLCDRLVSSLMKF